jgi:hypothetical protein
MELTPKEKAKELVDKYFQNWNLSLTVEDSKQCALIAVDELIGSYAAYSGMYDQEYFDSEMNYWIEVKQEINNL